MRSGDGTFQRRIIVRAPALRFLAGFMGFLVVALCAQPPAWSQASEAAPIVPPKGILQIVDFKADVRYLRAGAQTWELAATNVILGTGDELRTGERGQVTLRVLRDGSIAMLNEMTHARIDVRQTHPLLHVWRGIVAFFHRGEPGTFEVEGGGVFAIIRGTEFVFRVDDDQATTVTLYDGVVEMSNAQGLTTLDSPGVAEARPGVAPQRTAALSANDLTAIQWTLYYPAILDLAELSLPPGAEAELGDCLARYRDGDLPRALTSYPAGRTPASAAERVFLAALLLSVGQVEEARSLLEAVTPEPEARLAAAHQRLIAAVQLKPALPTPPARGTAQLATEWLADSYAWQARMQLGEAREAARRATERSPAFGFAWTRLAELEFGFGDTRAAARALAQATRLTPHNAQAVALDGFMLAARNRTRDAEARFSQALGMDGALGHAWLGRGLCRIRRGDLAGGREDLLTAAAREQQRALLRSYLGKAFSEEGGLKLAAHELALAQRLDPQDPTAWLYAALLGQTENRINDAIRSLEAAQDRTGNRALYRSRLMLDQDRAVASANLASVYRDAGLVTESVREAGRAVAYDYANPAAHAFLADSYVNSEKVNLRYETPRVAEYLVANLLAPVGGGVLSPTLSQQEYSRLFERDRLNVFSLTEYGSRGDWIESAALYGTWNGSSALADGLYARGHGYASNTDFEQAAWGAQIKQQVGARDSFYFQALQSWTEGGDLALYRDPAARDPDFRFEEELDPIVLAGWHRQWTPEHHTLLLAGWLAGRQEVRDPTQPVSVLYTNVVDPNPFVLSTHMTQEYASDTEVATVEAQHVWQTERNTLLAGVRYQVGQLATSNTNGQPRYVPAQPGLAETTSIRPDLERFQVYGYETFAPVPSLWLIAGLSYDQVRAPVNFRFAPLTDGEETVSQLSPKAGFIWSVGRNWWLRGAYTRSLGGVSYDQSFRLEPTQVAGFNQAFRSLIPESVAGPQTVPEFETGAVAVETRLGTGTYLSLSGEILRSETAQGLGVFQGEGLTFAPGLLIRELDYEERALSASVSQLLGRDWSVGARYRFSRCALADDYARYGLTAEDRSDLHRLDLFLRFNHPCGVFGLAELTWLHQANEGERLGLSEEEYGYGYPVLRAVPPWGEDLWQLNVYAGYRFARRRAELMVGVVNLTDQDYRLNPLSLYTAEPRERMFVARLKISF